MPPCLSLEIPIPTLPSLFVPSITIPGLPLPISGEFCCKFTLSNPAAAQAVIAGINATLASAGGVVNAAIGMVEAEIMAVAEPLLQMKLALSVSCPMNETVL